jgi:NAD(P)-dependent dehydrogenase (short-subunit alcohol dehydrogenase family)
MVLVLKNQVVAITGASAGLGRAAAREFGRHRAKVGLIARGVDGLKAASWELEASLSRRWIGVCLAAATGAGLWLASPQLRERRKEKSKRSERDLVRAA